MISNLLSNPIIAIVLLIGLLVFVHELGHYLVGKLCGVGVEVFSIGFGPPLLKWTRNHTVYQLAAVPLGGYVKFAGALPNEPVEEVHKGKEMYRARKLKRAAIIVAGPVANFLLAYCIYVVLGIAGLEYAPARIGTVLPNSAADLAGLRSGDEIVSISVADTDAANGDNVGDEWQISKWDEMRAIISRSPDAVLTLTVRRDQQLLELQLLPKNKEGVGRAGVGLDFERAIVAVGEGSPAWLAGMRSGDEVVAIELAGQQQAITDFSQLARWFDAPILDAAADVRVHYLRQGKEYIADLQDVQSKEKAFADLGFASSLLTIASVRAPALGVLEPQDQLFAVDGQPVENIYQLTELFQNQRQPEIEVEVFRAGKRLTLQVELEAHEVQRVEGAVTLYLLPVDYVGKLQRPRFLLEKYGLLGALGFGLRELWNNSGQVVGALVGLFTGSVPLQALGGPILIAKVAGDSAKAGWKMYLLTMAIISINLGIINLFPIPVLDGGQLVLVGMEAIKRRRLQMTTIENFQRLGFVMVLCLVVLATYNDLSRFWRSFLQGIAGYFE